MNFTSRHKKNKAGLGRTIDLRDRKTILTMPAKVLVLISGSGTNLQAIIDACATPKLPCSRITHVISNRKNAYGLERCKNSSPAIPTTVFPLLPFKKQHPDESEARTQYDAALAQLILDLPSSSRPDIIVCAGWMHILSPAFLHPIDKADIPIINLHPALPGAHDGKGAIEGAWEAMQEGKEKETGVMIHYVIAQVDRGEPILVQKVEMKEGESLEGLTERIHQWEHPSIVEGTRRVLDKRWKEGKIQLEEGEAGFS